MESLSAAFRAALSYLYRNSRPRFHAALFVMVYSLVFLIMFVPVILLLNLIPSVSVSIDYELAAIFVGLAALAELARGNVRHWLKVPPEAWSYPAMAAGGGAASFSFWLYIALKWGDQRWYHPLAFVAAGIATYVVCGYAMQIDERKQARTRHDT